MKFLIIICCFFYKIFFVLRYKKFFYNVEIIKLNKQMDELFNQGEWFLSIGIGCEG